MQLTDLLPFITENVSDVTRSMALRRMREASRDFFRETHAWRQDVVVPLVDGTHTYTLTMPTDGELVEVHRVLYDDTKRTPLVKFTETQLTERHYRPHQIGTVEGYTQPVPTDIRFYGTPGSADDAVNVTVNCSFRPVLTAAEIPDWVGNRYYEPIVWGTLALLYNMPDEKWSNITASQRFAGLFEDAKRTARQAVENEYSSRVVRVVQYGGL